MSENRKIINVSLHEDRRDRINKILDEMKKMELPKSGTICRLIEDFAKRGYVFDEADDV
jgi:hypothetical protein